MSTPSLINPTVHVPPVEKLSRRRALLGLIFGAPAVVAASSLMRVTPVHAKVKASAFDFINVPKLSEALEGKGWNTQSIQSNLSGEWVEREYIIDTDHMWNTVVLSKKEFVNQYDQATDRVLSVRRESDHYLVRI